MKEQIALGALVMGGLVLLACAAATPQNAEPRVVPVAAERASDAADAADAASPRASTPRPPSDVEPCGDGNYEACIRLYDRKGDKRPVIEQVLAYFATHTRGVKHASDAGALPLAPCASGDGHACADIALALEEARADREQSLRFHRLACVQGYWFSCNNLFLANDKVGAYVLAQGSMQSCDARRDAFECFSASHFLKPIDPAKAAAYLGKACERGGEVHCYEYARDARLYESDPAAFIAYVKRGCAAHAPNACDLLEFPTSRHVEWCRQGDKEACAFVPGHGVDGGAPSRP